MGLASFFHFSYFFTFLFLVTGSFLNPLQRRNMKASLFLLFQGVLLYVALGWKVRMPKDIHGLKGSCLVIPCSFNYTAYPPANPRRVVWYQWVSSGYPLVYDPRSPNDVIKKFRGKTDLYGDPSSRDCSLLIKNLELSHNGEKIYAWIDPENVGWRTYKFYDVTSTIQVDASPQQPSINLYGGERTGDNITVACSTFHTCPYSKPNITLNGIEGSDTIKDESFKDGLWQTTLTRTGVIKAENSTIECSATHHGGITVTATKNKSAQCVHHKIMIEPELGDVTEGVAKNFICSVYHSCQNENPTITWNYENMQDTKGNKKLSSLNQVTYSNITFLGANKDDGKKLICTANFSGGTITTSVVLHVQCVHHNISIEPELADVTEGVAKNFICSVYHSCQKENPSITWNFENMQVTKGNKTLSGLNQVTYSNITFLGAKEDHGKKLICTAKFSERDVTASVDLNVHSLSHNEADPVLTGLKTIGLYILTPSLVFLITCILAGVIIYKKRQRSKDAMSGNKSFSKPCMPSPKSDPKSSSDNDYEAEYTNMDELNMYGNI
ncbi:sialoadhesin-like isoform X1 [Labeo rohita]|uniref:sialoadhesin-like isoform X1 n=1 Tax=Labeo rohita TaxID=84645 RepID=UPI0021E24714|nr:sialoadhesin-like isoform X1 [Labeo rohita]